MNVTRKTGINAVIQTSARLLYTKCSKEEYPMPEVPYTNILHDLFYLYSRGKIQKFISRGMTPTPLMLRYRNEIDRVKNKTGSMQYNLEDVFDIRCKCTVYNQL